MHPQPEVYINLAPENVECEHKETMVTQTQMTGGVQGISCAITRFKNTETKVQYNSGCVENRAWNNDQMIAADQYSTGSLGPVIGFLESFKFEIQPQSNDTDGVNGYYQDSAGRTINYVMGDMNTAVAAGIGAIAKGVRKRRQDRLAAEADFDARIKEYEEKDRENNTKTPDEEIIERIIQVGFLKST